MWGGNTSGSSGAFSFSSADTPPDATGSSVFSGHAAANRQSVFGASKASAGWGQATATSGWGHPSSSTPTPLGAMPGADPDLVSMLERIEKTARGDKGEGDGVLQSLAEWLSTKPYISEWDEDHTRNRRLLQHKLWTVQTHMRSVNPEVSPGHVTLSVVETKRLSACLSIISRFKGMRDIDPSLCEDLVALIAESSKWSLTEMPHLVDAYNALAGVPLNIMKAGDSSCVRVIVGQMSRVFPSFQATCSETPELFEALIDLLCHILDDAPKTVVRPGTLSFGMSMGGIGVPACIDDYVPLCLDVVHTLLSQPGYGTDQWQPKRVIDSLVRHAPCQSQALINHPVYEYILSPARQYDMSVNGLSLYRLLTGGVLTKADTPGPVPFRLAAQGLLGGLSQHQPHVTPGQMVGGPERVTHQESVDVCWALITHYLTSDGVLRPDVAHELSVDMPGPTIHGVPTSLIDTLSHCEKVCSSFSAYRPPLNHAAEVQAAVTAFIHSTHQSRPSRLLGAVRVLRVPSTAFRPELPCSIVSTGSNTALLVGFVEGGDVSHAYRVTLSVNESGCTHVGIEREDNTGDGKKTLSFPMGSCAAMLGGKVYVCGDVSDSHPCLWVHTLETNSWETHMPSGSQVWPPSLVGSAAAVSDTEFLFVQKPPPMEHGKQEQRAETRIYTWLFDTSRMEWKMATPAPTATSPDVSVDGVTALSVGSSVHILATFQFSGPSYHASLHEDEWSTHQESTLHLQDIGGGMALSFDKDSVRLYDTKSDHSGEVLAILPGASSKIGHYLTSSFKEYTSCMANEETVLLIGLRPHPSFLMSTGTMVHAEMYLIHVNRERARQCFRGQE
ncbi:hypothetical protein KIPB_001989 [Kipferlia bialata]|uniref:Uncharacterized protein n=1 Tax=Kipferlia bialata TaxID=797122 RepID=A0A9K3GGC5_9EUKA|nr:hypothetical protein KIPB_001989 [Kipferlia bialata]|eukprot:g1989.t1